MPVFDDTCTTDAPSIGTPLTLRSVLFALSDDSTCCNVYMLSVTMLCVSDTANRRRDDDDDDDVVLVCDMTTLAIAFVAYL